MSEMRSTPLARQQFLRRLRHPGNQTGRCARPDCAIPAEPAAFHHKLFGRPGTGCIFRFNGISGFFFLGSALFRPRGGVLPIGNAGLFRSGGSLFPFGNAGLFRPRGTFLAFGSTKLSYPRGARFFPRAIDIRLPCLWHNGIFGCTHTGARRLLRPFGSALFPCNNTGLFCPTAPLCKRRVYPVRLGQQPGFFGTPAFPLRQFAHTARLRWFSRHRALIFSLWQHPHTPTHRLFALWSASPCSAGGLCPRRIPASPRRWLSPTGRSLSARHTGTQTKEQSSLYHHRPVGTRRHRHYCSARPFHERQLGAGGI